MKFLFPLAALVIAMSQSGQATMSFKRHGCAPNMTCVSSGPRHSVMPQQIAQRSELVVPPVCVKDVMGTLDRSEVAVCEAFVGSGEGTPRQRATAMVNLGHAYHWEKDNASPPKEAMKMWELAAATDPTFAEPLVLKANAFSEAGQGEEAIKLFELAWRLDPDHWRAVIGAALAFERMGKIEHAINTARNAAERAPGAGLTHQIYGEILERAGRLEEALAEMEKSTVDYEFGKRRVPGFKQSADSWSALARLQSRMGKHAQAVVSMSKLIDGLPDSSVQPFDLASRAEYYERLGWNGEAASDLERAALLLGPETEVAGQWRTKAALLTANSSNAESAKEQFSDILRKGNLQSILRIQVFLRNNGFDGVAIDGRITVGLQRALNDCLAKRGCMEAFGQPI